MRFFDEMRTKWGFGDGDATPDGARVYREAYLRVLNALLAKHKSEARLAAYDRPGMHNSVLIIKVTVEQFSNMSDEDIYGGEYNFERGVELEDDEAYRTALGDAYDMEIDDFVNVEVKLAKDELEDFIVNNFGEDND